MPLDLEVEASAGAIVSQLAVVRIARARRKPAIDRVFGSALGAGCDLAVSCDMFLAADTTILGVVFSLLKRESPNIERKQLEVNR